MCLWLLRTTQSLLRLVSRPLLIVQQTTQHGDESRAGSVSTDAQTTFNHRNPGQISRPSCSQIGEKRKERKKKLRSRSKSERLLPPKHGPLALQMENRPFSFHTASDLLGFHLCAFMPVQESCIRRECRSNTPTGFHVAQRQSQVVRNRKLHNR